MFKTHELYPLFETYIDTKKISNGAKRLLKLSESSFTDFKFQYENSNHFKQKIDDLLKREIRDIKIDDLLDDEFFG